MVYGVLTKTKYSYKGHHADAATTHSLQGSTKRALNKGCALLHQLQKSLPESKSLSFSMDLQLGSGKFCSLCEKEERDASTHSVLALGDQNYDKFCFVGKLIDTKLQAIGATQVFPVVMADEVLGLDQFVEPWLERVNVVLSRATKFADVYFPSHGLGKTL
jgi:sulfite reductase alpha subunit-like flavoprotein